MPQDAAPAVGLSGSIRGWQPATFQERGVAVPFTTPQLTGARLRPGESGRMELILPDVGGPGSVGILPWDRVASLCSPTLFDRRLGARLLDQPALTPAVVRQAACVAAAAGLAGQEAQEAALAAQAADAAERARVRADLLAPGRADDAASVPEELAALLGPIGLGRDATAARLPRTLAAVTAFGARISEYQHVGPTAGDAGRLAAAARRTAAAALAALLAARGITDHAPALLQRWAAAPAALAEELRRPEWLLDGWAWLCRLWHAPEARPGRVGVSLADLSVLLPPLPLAAGAAPVPPRRAGMAGAVHSLLRVGDWRSGVTLQDVVARNERLLAGVLMLPGEPW